MSGVKSDTINPAGACGTGAAGGDGMRRCLIVVDYQQEFVAGRHGFPAARRIDRAIAGKILAFREAGDEVLFTLDAAGGPRLYGTVFPTNYL